MGNVQTLPRNLENASPFSVDANRSESKDMESLMQIWHVQAWIWILIWRNVRKTVPGLLMSQSCDAIRLLVLCSADATELWCYKVADANPTVET